MKTIKIKLYEDIPDNFTGIAECPNERKEYYVDGKLHRLDGPAIEHVNGIKYYYINDKLITKEAQELLYAMMKLKGIIRI